MSLKEKLLARLDALITTGTELSNQSKFREDESLYSKWTINYENILQKIYNKERAAQILKEIENKAAWSEYAWEDAQYITKVLEATRDDLEKGIIGNIEREIKKVEVNNLLDYSFKLLDEKDDAIDRCACVLARIVLEKTVQLLCVQYNLDSTKKASVLNQQLWKNGVYTQSMWHHVDGLLAIGNAAAHSSDEWEKYGKNERNRMITNVETFVKESL